MCGKSLKNALSPRKISLIGSILDKNNLPTSLVSSFSIEAVMNFSFNDSLIDSDKELITYSVASHT